MKKILLFIPAITFAMMPGPVMHPPTPTPTTTPPLTQPVPPNTVQASQPSSGPPIEVKLSPEDKKILELKKKMEYQQTYNSYRKLKEAETLDEMSLRLSKLQTENSIQQTINQWKVLSSVPPIVYELPIVGTVGNIAVTTSMALPSGAKAFNLPVQVKDNNVYMAGLGVAVPPTIVQPQNTTPTAPSTPSLMTGLPTPPSNPSGPLPPLSSLVGSTPPPSPPPGAP